MSHRICGARLISGLPCAALPAHLNGRCRHHGGFEGTGGAPANQNALRHGLYARGIQHCGPHCPLWSHCPLAKHDVIEIPAKQRPECPYEVQQYTLELESASGRAPGASPEVLHLSALLGAMTLRAAAAMSVSPLFTVDSQGNAERVHPALDAFRRLSSEYRRYQAMLGTGPPRNGDGGPGMGGMGVMGGMDGVDGVDTVQAVEMTTPERETAIDPKPPILGTDSAWLRFPETFHAEPTPVSPPPAGESVALGRGLASTTKLVEKAQRNTEALCRQAAEAAPASAVALDAPMPPGNSAYLMLLTPPPSPKPRAASPERVLFEQLSAQAKDERRRWGRASRATREKLEQAQRDLGKAGSA